MILISACVVAQPRPAPVDEYPIHEDGGIIYNPLSREAEATGQLIRYRNAPTQTHYLKLGKYNLSLEAPRDMRAYDVVPIRYKLSWSGDTKFPVAVEATAFEEESRRKGRDIFDLALPGKLDLDVEYLGSITAHLRPSGRHNIKPDMSDTPKTYPPFDRKPLVKSGVVEAGDLVWFKFRFKNTGNTILDPEGFGGCQFYPELYRKDASGEYKFIGNPYNLYYRDLKYLYPGESHETWFHFMVNGPGETPQNYGLVVGDYKIRFRMVYRTNKKFDTFVNIWDGPPMYVWDLQFKVEKEARQAPVEEGKVVLTDAGEPDKITRWVHTLEEFMTAFDCHITQPRSGNPIEGTLHLQVAPWTEQIVVKLIGTDPVSINTIAVPVNVDSDSLAVRFNPNNQMTIIKDGLRCPIIYSQTMADMRTNVQIGPFPETHIRERLREMMDCGINIVATTSMPWLYDDMHNPASNNQGDAWKYFLDCARAEGMILEGWGTYPYDRASIQSISNWITGQDTKMDVYTLSGYPAVSHADPNLPPANANAWLYQFHRWGDLYHQMENGLVPIGVEDTRGWMRQDINIRYQMGDRSIQAFSDWVKAKYGTIEATNAAWGSSYDSFEKINPEDNGVLNLFGHKWEYTDSNKPFHDWSPAIADFDRFRTEMRVKNYRDTLDIVQKEIPNAHILIRTEGGNVLVKGINPEDTNPHFRHIYYSQRRCGLIADIIQDSGTVKWHSDYTTMPYTPSELRRLTRLSVAQGLLPCYLAQFDNMRDIAINTKYGSEYGINYNLPEPRKGAMMHVLAALYPWFTAVYEEGGAPGLLWEDYQCDGFATATQKREMRFFKEKLEKAISTPEALRARSENIQEPSQEWRNGVKAIRCYDVK